MRSGFPAFCVLDLGLQRQDKEVMIGNNETEEEGERVEKAPSSPLHLLQVPKVTLHMSQLQDCYS